MKNRLTIILICTFILGCTSTTSMSLKEKDKEYDQYVTDQKLSSEDQVKGFKFSGWKSLSDNYLIITAVHKKDYLIETKGRCIELNNSHAIQINQYSSLSISKYGDSISPSRKAIDKCFIKTIYPITDIQTDYLVNIGKSEKNGV